MKRLLHITFLLLLFGCQSEKKVQMDEYTFTISDDYEIDTAIEDENVMLTLYSKENGISVILQNKLNILAETMLANVDDADKLKQLHRLKFDSYIKMMGGYFESPIDQSTYKGLEFTQQSCMVSGEGDMKALFDLRILQVNDDYYAFYSTDAKFKEHTNDRDVLDCIFKSITIH